MKRSSGAEQWGWAVGLHWSYWGPLCGAGASRGVSDKLREGGGNVLTSKGEQGFTGTPWDLFPLYKHPSEIFKPVTSQHVVTQQHILRHQFHRFIPSPPWQLSKSLFSFRSVEAFHSLVHRVIQETGGPASDRERCQSLGRASRGVTTHGGLSRELTGTYGGGLLSLLKRWTRA